jgi:hypothetical protein
VSIAAARSEPRRDWGWWLLLVLEIVVAANAVGGGIYGLSGADGVPPEWLDGSPFETYLIPSLALLVVVGGSMATAAAALLTHRRRAPEISIGAGIVLLVWLAIEMLIIPLSWLQLTFLVVALLVIGLGFRARVC